MFINDVNKKEEIKSIATQDLRKYGIKFRPKKPRPSGQTTRPGKKVFKVPLDKLETETVTLPNGQQLIAPKRVNEMCSFILTKVQTEGIFRKEGSKSRQNEIKLSLDRGCLLGDEHHVIDVAAVLKSFLRELPEPLIPSSYHELFLRCSIGENRLKATMLACLLLPTEHLSLLSYLMQFFHEVASYSSFNKMNYNNLAILIGPNIFPVDEKLAPKTSLIVTKICDITKQYEIIIMFYLLRQWDCRIFADRTLLFCKYQLRAVVYTMHVRAVFKLPDVRPCPVVKKCLLVEDKMLIENSRSIGLIPDYIIDHIGHMADPEFEKRRKKRRSGSLTKHPVFLGMLSGLKKIVSNKSEEDSNNGSLPTPDLLLTPVVMNGGSMKKKKGENGLSVKKKKEILAKLPDCALLNTPFTPSRTPISNNPNGKKLVEHVPLEGVGSLSDLQKEKKMHWYMRSKSVKNLKDDDSSAPAISNTHRTSLGGSTKHMLERRWSAVSNAANFRKKKRTSCAATKKEMAVVVRKMETLKSTDEPDYVRVPKNEYEDIRNRVSLIERRISMELDQVQSNVPLENDENVNANNVLNVQTAYEKTLVHVEPLSPTTDQLARRLSRDLKIRRSGERRVMRSPSARKIGTIRRRSGEREKKSSQLARHQSWHVGTAGVDSAAPLLPRVSMRRKKNLVQDATTSQISSKKQNTTSTNVNVKRTSSFPNSKRLAHRPVPSPSTPPQNRLISSTKSPQTPQSHRRVSFDLPEVEHDHFSNPSAYNSTLETSNEHWVSAEGFFTGAKTPLEDSGGGGVKTRASIAKLRSQNMGMVRAKAKVKVSFEDSQSVKIRPSIAVLMNQNVGRVRATAKVKGTFENSKSLKIRPSIAVLRSQNVGKVRATAKLFDNLQDSDTSAASLQSLNSTRSQPGSAKKVSVKTGHKIGSIRTSEARMSYRVRKLRSEERKVRKSLSPRKRNTSNLNPKKLQQIGKQYVRMRENSLEEQVALTPRKDLISSPRRTPQNQQPRMKAPLSTKTPKRLCRTPAFSGRNTPMKVIPSTPM